MKTENKKERIPFKKKYKNLKTEWPCIAVLCAPAIIHLLVFWLGVQLETFRMAFTDAQTGAVNLDNFGWAFKQLFAGAAVSELSLAFVNTMLFFLLGCAIIPIAMFFAYLIFRRTIGASFMRISLYLPGAVSGVMMALLYAKLMESTSPLMQAIQNATGASEAIMMKINYGIIYIMIYDLLVGVGGNLVMWLGGMSRIPYDLIEYGKLEGIGPFREFATVVLPLIWPTFITMVTLQIIGIFGSSGSVLMLTDGQYGTYTLSFWMYKMVQAGLTSEYNRVAALGLIFTIVTIPLVVFGRKFMNKFGEEVEY